MEITKRNITLPEELSDLFWDCDFHALDWKQNPHFILKRVLNSESTTAIEWVLKTFEKNEVKEWLIEHKTSWRSLSSKMIAFWGLILDVPEDVTQYREKEQRNGLWEKRVLL